MAADIFGSGKGGTFITERFRHTVLDSLGNSQIQRSWVSGGWASPCGVHPTTPEIETAIILSLVRELKGIFQPFELGGETILIQSAVKH